MTRTLHLIDDLVDARWRIDRTDARALVIALVSEALGREPASLRVEHLCPRCGSDAHGSPFVADAAGRVSGVWVSLSRRGAWSAAIVSSSGPVGIDIEDAAASVPPAVVAHPDERWAPQLLPRVWAAKEATLKALGTGLATDPRSVYVSAALDRAMVAGASFALTPLAAPPGLVAFACREASPVNLGHEEPHPRLLD